MSISAAIWKNINGNAWKINYSDKTEISLIEEFERTENTEHDNLNY
jgi:hypothetical protein